MAKKPGELTVKQRRFVEEYLVDANATQAAIRAGYSVKTAGQIGDENLKKPHIAAAIEVAEAERAERAKATADDVLLELAKLGLSNMRDYVSVTSDGDPYVDLPALTPEQWAAVSEVTVDDYLDGRGDDARAVKRVKIKLYDKKGPLGSCWAGISAATSRRSTMCRRRTAGRCSSRTCPTTSCGQKSGNCSSRRWDGSDRGRCGERRSQIARVRC